MFLSPTEPSDILDASGMTAFELTPDPVLSFDADEGKGRRRPSGSAFTLLEQEVVRIALMEGNTPVRPTAGDGRLAVWFDRLQAAVLGDRRKGPLGDPRLETLRRFTAAARAGRRALDRRELRRFLQAGFTLRHVFEVVLVVAASTISGLDSQSRKLMRDTLADGIGPPQF